MCCSHGAARESRYLSDAGSAHGAHGAMRCPLVPSRATVVGWRLSVIPVVVATEATQAKHDWEKNVSTK